MTDVLLTQRDQNTAVYAGTSLGGPREDTLGFHTSSLQACEGQTSAAQAAGLGCT